MGIVGNLEILGYLGAVAIKVVGHIVVFLTQHTPADEIAIATRHCHKSAVELVGETLCKAQSGQHCEEGCENKLLHKWNVSFVVN